MSLTHSFLSDVACIILLQLGKPRQPPFFVLNCFSRRPPFISCPLSDQQHQATSFLFVLLPEDNSHHHPFSLASSLRVFQQSRGLHSPPSCILLLPGETSHHRRVSQPFFHLPVVWAFEKHQERTCTRQPLCVGKLMGPSFVFKSVCSVVSRLPAITATTGHLDHGGRWWWPYDMPYDV